MKFMHMCKSAQHVINKSWVSANRLSNLDEALRTPPKSTISLPVMSALFHLDSI